MFSVPRRCPRSHLCLALLLLFGSRSQLRADAMLQLFNLSWNEVAEKLPEIAEAGSGYSVGYDLFDPFDLGDKNQRGTVSTRYGSKEELLRLIRLAHRFGLRVHLDTVVNHRGFDVPGYDANTPTN